MKFFRQFSSVLLVFVLSFGLFSFTANAESIDASKLGVLQVNLYASYDDYLDKTVISSYDPTKSGLHSNDLYYIGGIFNYWWTEFVFSSTDGSILVEADDVCTLRIDNFFIRLDSNYLNSVNGISFVYQYIDGTYGRQEALSSFTKNGDHISLNLPFVPEKDVIGIWVTLLYDTTDFGIDMLDDFYHLNYETGSNDFVFSLVVEREEVGLLKGVVEWLKSIKNGITNVFDSIVELPAKIWGFISDGLKNLFIPSEFSMRTYSDKWNSLLIDRFGGVYQVANTIKTFWERVMEYDETDTILFPSVIIDLPGGSSFSFGGYYVPIIMEDFEFIADILKVIFGIIVTFMFINGLYHRYDEVMGVEQ